MKICFFGIYNPDYPRNKILLAGLRANGAEVVECREPASSPWRYMHLIKRLYRESKDYDVVYAAYPSPMAAIIAKLFSGKKLALDAFYSMYEAVVYDRAERSRWHPLAFKLWLLDWLSVVLADVIIVDTAANGDYWAGWPLVRASKIRVVPVGVDTSRTKPIPDAENSLLKDSSKNPGLIPVKKVTVTFHGTYIPLQGAEKIVEAINILKKTGSGFADISFRMIGDGGVFPKIQKKITALGLQENIELIGRVDYETLISYLNLSDIVLGIFGDTAKAQRVVANKVYEGCAVGKAVITMDTPAVREMFSQDEICLVQGDSKSIADAITRLHRDGLSLQKIAAAGHSRVTHDYNPSAIARVFLAHLAGL